MSRGHEQPDLLVLGGGPAGYVAAIAAAQRGARVALVEQAKVGGTCLNVGCIPTKALATSADLLVRAKRAIDFEVTIPQATVDLPRLMRYKQAVVDQLVGGVEQLLRARRVKLCHGHGRLVHPRAIAVQAADRIEEISAPRVILATGSIPLEPAIEGRELPGVVDSTGFLADRVLVATGRRPNTENADLTQAGVHVHGRAIAVDDRLRTNLPDVWAVGDAVGGWMLAHKAMVEGRIAAENATGGHRMIDYRSVPNVMFTRPEVAGVGLTEVEARRQGAAVKVSQFAFSANPKARILGESDGLVRLVCEAGSGTLQAQVAVL